MRRLSLVEAQPDMILASDIVNDQQMLLLKKGAALNDKNIKMLKSWGVAVVEIESESDSASDTVPSDGGMDGDDIAKRIEERFGPLGDDEVMREIRRVATDIIVNRFHQQDAVNAG